MGLRDNVDADAAGGLSDEAWALASPHYDEEGLAALACLLAAPDVVTSAASRTSGD